MSFYPNGPHGGWVIDVENPGYGEVLVGAPYEILDRDWHQTLVGPEIGEFLTEVTARALGGEAGTWAPFLTTDAARAILPSLQEAALLAAAGTDRYERIFADGEGLPQEPLCSRCNEGTVFTPGAMPNEDCDRYGHTPFGYDASTRWANAQATHMSRRERWERRRALGLTNA